MKIYVASGFENKGNARKLMNKLESRGHIITRDWTVHEFPEGASPSTLDALRKVYGEEDIKGVFNCDMLVLLQPGADGSHTELGMAIGKSKRIVIIGEKERKNVFYYTSNIDYKFEDVESFLTFIDNSDLDTYKKE
jgi:hypothetical protein